MLNCSLYSCPHHDQGAICLELILYNYLSLDSNVKKSWNIYMLFDWSSLLRFIMSSWCNVNDVIYLCFITIRPKCELAIYILDHLSVMFYSTPSFILSIQWKERVVDNWQLSYFVFPDQSFGECSISNGLIIQPPESWKFSIKSKPF